jgi:hypothetical protein
MRSTYAAIDCRTQEARQEERQWRRRPPRRTVLCELGVGGLDRPTETVDRPRGRALPGAGADAHLSVDGRGEGVVEGRLKERDGSRCHSAWKQREAGDRGEQPQDRRPPRGRTGNAAGMAPGDPSLGNVTRLDQRAVRTLTSTRFSAACRSLTAAWPLEAPVHRIPERPPLTALVRHVRGRPRPALLGPDVQGKQRSTRGPTADRRYRSGRSKCRPTSGSVR